MTKPNNRRARRAAVARAKHSGFYEGYVRHLPEVPVDAPLGPGGFYHLVIQHDDWCRFYETENFADCNCKPIVSRHIDPKEELINAPRV